MTSEHCRLAVMQEIGHLAGADHVRGGATSGTVNRRRGQAAGTPVPRFGLNFEGQGP